MLVDDAAGITFLEGGSICFVCIKFIFMRKYEKCYCLLRFWTGA